MKLNDKQQEAIDAITAWYNNPGKQQIFVLAGLAGTGKTTIISTLLQGLEGKAKPVVCSFTGKAVNVLRTKGLQAQTIHSLIYEYDFINHRWIRLPTIPHDLIIVDEASMLSKDLLADLRSYGKLILAVGDHGQLPPIGDDPGLMRKPHITLEQIHRQAADSPIINIAHEVRLGEFPVASILRHQTPDIKLTHVDDIIANSRKFNQIICGLNSQRETINRAIRKSRGYSGYPRTGEKLICLRNDPRHGVYNGQLALMTSEGLRLDDGRIIPDPPLSVTTLATGKPPKFPEGQGELHYTFGYAITVHKAQGSEWQRVAIASTFLPFWDMPRFNYTAITRASEKLSWA